jgi:hypothetical protein
MAMTISFKDVYQGEIFQKTCCIDQENALMERMAQYMQQQGYTGHHPLHKIWTRGSRQIIQCLVDDFFTCGDSSQSTAALFAADTTVITDNWCWAEVPYEIVRLPDSFFGTFAYEPSIRDWQPTHRFGFCVNRIDPLRIRLLCEIADIDQDLVNVNCLLHDHRNVGPDQLRENFLKYREEVDHARFDYWANIMPVRNHNLTLEQVHASVQVNIVVETYAGPDIVALSEKTWRAVQTPAPWMIYAGRGSVKFLRNLGFDVLDDVVDHSYDQETDWNAKIAKFGQCAQRTAQSVIQKSRVEAAAQHNQQLLATMKRQWPHDLAQWWLHYQEVTA